MNTKKVIVFDFDGVLYDSVEVMHQYTLNKYKNLTHDDVMDFHKENIHDQSIIDTWEKTLYSDEEKEERKKRYIEEKNSCLLYPGIKVLLHDLTQIYTLVINTSAEKVSSQPILERENIDHLFSFIATREVHTSKGEKFKMISEMYHTPLSEMIFITDTVSDIKEAARVGVPTVAVTWGVHDETHFREETYPNLVAVVDSVEELQAVLLK